MSHLCAFVSLRCDWANWTEDCEPAWTWCRSRRGLLRGSTHTDYLQSAGDLGALLTRH
jgi:hypothetical protein